MGARTGIPEDLIPLDLPLSSILDVGLERHSQLHQVDSGGASDDNVRRWSVVAMSWGKLYWPGRSAVMCISDGRWLLQKSKMTVVPQTKGLLAGVENVGKILVLSTELA